MAYTNIFMNGYKQPENKLTYNLLCLVEHMNDQKKFCEYLTGLKLSNSPVLSVSGVFGGYESNPDGMIRLQSADNNECEVFLENKTHRLQASREQLERHYDVHCKQKNSWLVLITPRKEDKEIVKVIGKENVIHRTWDDIAKELSSFENDDLLVRQFVEYGKLSGEFGRMNPDSADIDAYITCIKNNVEFRIRSVVESAVSEIDLDSYNIKVESKCWQSHWGRCGIEFSFDKKNDFGQWLFFGIYHDKRNHEIEFKKDNEPELAFFFDIDKNKRDGLGKIVNFSETLRSFCQTYDYENNFNESLTKNKDRLFYKRWPLSGIGEFTVPVIRDYFECILRQITNDSLIKKTLLL